jgi:thymidylate synthase
VVHVKTAHVYEPELSVMAELTERRPDTRPALAG